MKYKTCTRSTTITNFDNILLNDLFTKQALKTPKNIALEFGCQQLTYCELENLTNKISNKIRTTYKLYCGKEINPDTIIGICLERSLNLVIGIISILKAGAAFVAISQHAPKERNSYIVFDTKMRFIVTDSNTKHIKFKNNIYNFCIDESKKINLNDNKVTYTSHKKFDSLAYLSYTSGSTGMPKGVMIEHKSVVNLLFAMQTQFSLTIKDRFLATTTLGFDIAILELFLPIVTGATVIISPEISLLSANDITSILRKNKITIMQATPVIWDMISDSNWKPNKNFKLLCGGEALTQPLANKLFKNLGIKNIFNLYGPTETTIWSSIANIKPKSKITIGKPINNTEMHVLNSELQPTNTIGELYIGGKGLARGYLNNPKLTLEKFINLPQKTLKKLQSNYCRFYKTGDLVKQLKDGSFDFIGRVDRQKKIHGIRFELEEIETALANHNKIASAAVELSETKDNKKLLAFLITHDTNINTNELKKLILDLKKYLNNKLIPQLIPSKFIFLKSFPLNTNGKIDHNALLEYTKASARIEQNNIINNNAYEKLLKMIWEEVLSINIVNINTNFFSIGGDSIQAIKVINKAIDKGLNLSVQDLYNHNTIKKLAKVAFNKKITTNSRTINKTQHQEILKSITPSNYLLSPLQQGMLFYSITTNKPIYVTQLAWKYHGNLDIAKLKKAWEQVVKQNDVLRTSFEWQNDTLPSQKIIQDVEIDWTEEDWATISNKQLDKKLASHLNKIAQIPFDFKKPSLSRFNIIKLNNYYLFVWTYHHIILDGWSVAIILKQIKSYYNNNYSKIRTVSSYPQYHQFIKWLYARNNTDSLLFWKKFLGNFKAPNTFIFAKQNRKLSINAPNKKFASCYKKIEKIIIEAVKKTASTNRITYSSILNFCWGMLLSKYIQTNDVVFGAVISGRPSEIENIDKIAGMFINCLPIRINISEKSTICQLLKKTHNTLQKINQHGNASLNDIYKINNISPEIGLFYSTLTIESYPENKIFTKHLEDEIDITYTSVLDQNNYPLQVIIEDIDDPRLIIHYDVKNFNKTRIENLIEHYINSLKWVIGNQNKTISSFDCLSASESKTMLVTWNNSEYNKLPSFIFPKLFEKTACQFPSKIAVEYLQKRLTYYKLNILANKLANYLLENFQQPNKQISLFIERSELYLIAIIGVLKSGNSFIPLLPGDPLEKHKNIVNQIDNGIILTTNKYLSYIRKNFPKSSILSLNEILKINNNNKNPTAHITESSLAYILFTSGSTGSPKGAMIEHKGMVNHLYSKIIGMNLTKKDNIAQTASQVFDISIWQFLCALLVGGKTVIIPDKTVYSPKDLLSHLNKNSISIFECVPSLLRAILDFIKKPKINLTKKLRYLMLTGEILPAKICIDWLKMFPKIPIINAYGPTECSDDVTHYFLKKQPKKNKDYIPIGKPIINTKLYVLDKNMLPVPVGVPGELYVAGMGVGKGYLNDIKKTEKSFVKNPYSSQNNYKTLYKTGDTVVWLEDGNLEFIGRNNTQVKINGCRVELGEIESAINNYSKISQCIVLLLEQNNSKYLTAFVVAKHNVGSISTQDIQKYLENYLPRYMIPSHFIFLDTMPLNSNGKIDRKELSRHIIEFNISSSNKKMTLAKEEQEILEIWKQVLHKNPTDNTQNFFYSGGNSLLAVKLVNEVNKKYKRKLPVSWAFSYKTIFEQSKYLQRKTNHKYKLIKSHYLNGKKQPIILIHPSIAGAEVYDDFIKTISKNHPIHLFDSYNLNINNAIISSIKELASLYISELLTVQPYAPYCLGGWSLGGLIAYEMAQQLKKNGHVVNLLFMFDTFLLSSSEKESEKDTLLTQRALLKQTKTFNIYNKKQKERILSLFDVESAMITDYVAETYDGNVLLFKALKPYYLTKHDNEKTRNLQSYINLLIKNINNGWENAKITGLLTKPIDCNHFQIITKPYIKKMICDILKVICASEDLS